MKKFYKSGYVRLNPEIDTGYDIGLDGEAYANPKYPFNIPCVYLEGAYVSDHQEYTFNSKDDSVIVVNNNVLIKYTHHICDVLLAEDKEGNPLGVDSRDTHEFDIEEIHLDTLEKKKFKVTLESTSPMNMNDFFKLIDYIDPNIIKKSALRKIPTPSN